VLVHQAGLQRRGAPHEDRVELAPGDARGVGADAVDLHQHALCLFDDGSVVGDFG
jgi:hypothetical protein